MMPLIILKKHTENVPIVESHYCRKNSKNKYLEQGLKIKHMYRLYKISCETDGRKPVSEFKYQNVFNLMYNLCFHVPKKDQYDTCTI